MKQEKLIKIAIKKACKNTFYKDKYKNLNKKDIYNIKKLPFLNKDEIYKIKNPKKYFILFSSSGSTSNPKSISFPYEDFLKSVNRIVKSYKLAGVTKEDVVMNTFAYGPYVAGHMYDQAAKQIGCAIIPFGSGGMTPTSRKIKIMEKIPVTVINGNPSYILRILEKAKESKKFDEIKNNIRVIQVAGEKLTESVRKKIEEGFDAEVFNQYGTTEIHSIAAECKYHDGMHVFEDHYIEIINPKTKKEVEVNKVGELVITEINVSYNPAIRYCTSDLVINKGNKCKCKSKLPKIHIVRRLDDSINIKGILISKNEIEMILEENLKIRNFILEIDKLEKIKFFSKEDVNKSLVQQVIKDKFNLHIDSVRSMKNLNIPKTLSGKLLRIVDKRRK